METKKPYGTVLIKAAALLDYIAEHPEDSLQEIAQGTNLTLSTALKILDTLTLIGYTEKSEKKTYSLGPKLMQYAKKDVEQADLIKQTMGHLEELQEKIDETIHLGILSNNEILYLNKLEPKNQSIRMSSRIGITRPLYSSAMGKAVLAEFTDEQISEYLEAHTLVPFTENTIVNPLKLRKELEQIRERKVAFDDEEMEKDIFCFGASIMKDRKILGAFSISMPKYRLTPALEQMIIQETIAIKKKIEKSLM
ncbi:MAG: IclR family transcriptional regulator [Enterococcus sp.]